MPQFDSLPIEAVRTKARFYLNSAVRAEVDIERLKKILAGDRAEAAARGQKRRHLAKVRRAKRRKEHTNWTRMKDRLWTLQQAARDHRAVMEMFSPSEVIQVDLTRNPVTGVWE